MTGKMFPWVNGTWNPVKGCEHECKYCWARALAKQKLKNTERYSDGFKPRFFEGDLKRRFGKGNSIFVSDMGDLFGEWVPREWITKILDCIKRSPEAEFLLLTFPYLYKPYKPYCSIVGRCAGRNPPSVLSGIRLYGLPAPPAGGYRRLFALSPCGSAVSAQPPGVLAPDRGSQHLPGEVSFLSGADALASRLAASQPCSVDGVSSDPLGGPAAAHRLTDRETNEDGGV